MGAIDDMKALNLDDAVAHISRLRKQTIAQFNRDMAKLDDDERELLGLRKLKRDAGGNCIGFADQST